MIYKTLVNRSLLIVLFFSPQLSAIEFKHELQEELETAYTEEVFRDDNGAPTIFFGKKDPKCTKNCSNALSFDGKRKLTFPKKSYLLTTTRYTGESFAIIRQPIKDSSYSHFYFISSSSLNKSFSYKLIFTPCSGSSTIITRDGALVCLSEKTIEIYKKPTGRDQKVDESNVQVLKLPAKAQISKLNNNLTGDIGIAIINTEQQKLYYAELNNLLMLNRANSAWSSHYTLIHDRSDSRDVLAVYPNSSSHGVVAAYEYVNVLNKNTTIYNFEDNAASRRIITNNINGNFGTNPEVFFYDDEQVLFTAKSSEDGDLHSYLIDVETLKAEETFYSDNPEQSNIDFLSGYSIALNSWFMSQSAGDSIRTDYDINNSLLQSVYFQARYRDTQLTLKYLTNEVKESSTNSVSYLTGLVDFNGFFDGADTLRLQVDWSQLSGTATYKSTDYLINGESEFSSKFESDYKNFELLIFSEHGNYFGFSYSTMAMPSAIGLSISEESTSIVGWAFDEDYKQTTLMLKAGSDEAAYGARYEVNYNRGFFRPNIGVGLVGRGISDAAITEATSSTTTKKITGDWTWVALLGLDTGYTHQRRWEEYKGIGYSVQLGLRAELYYQAESYQTADDEELFVNMERFDFNLGPYVQFNAIF